MGLTDSDRSRYDRQMMIEGIGEEGQKRLKEAEVFVAGAGGLGSPISIYLAVAGVGKLRIVDKDTVEKSNLNRQILHFEGDIGKSKVQSAKEKLTSLNPDIEVEPLEEEITEDNVMELVGDADVILDAMDNFETRFALNRASQELGIPLMHGAIYGLEGRATTIVPGRTGCLKCTFKKAPPKVVFPVIGVTPALIGVIQATETIKYITGVGELLENRLLIYDLEYQTFREVKLAKDPDCEVCSDR